MLAWLRLWFLQYVVRRSFSIPDGQDPVEPLREHVRAWINDGLGVVVIHYRPRKNTLVKVHDKGHMIVYDVLREDEAIVLIDAMRRMECRSDSSDFSSLISLATLDVDDLFVSLEMDIIPATPSGMDIAIYINSIEVAPT